MITDQAKNKRKKGWEEKQHSQGRSTNAKTIGHK